MSIARRRDRARAALRAAPAASAALALCAALASPRELRAQAGPGPVPAPAVRVEYGVHMPMRDGVELVADIWRPATPGRYPVILVRTPYMKNAPWVYASQYGRFFASHGYVYVIQDVRGRGDSGGTFEFFAGDGRDGFDSIEWLAGQPWSNGRVGTMGVSYLATVQWMAARERPPHLACIAPMAPAGRYFSEIPYQGGAFLMDWALHWLNGTSGRIQQDLSEQDVDWSAVYAHRPLLTMDSVMGRELPIYRAFLQHPTMDAYWRRIQFEPDDFTKIDVPALTITGWWDGDQPGALYYFEQMRAHSPAADRQYLVIGPWQHAQTWKENAPTKLGDWDFPKSSVVDNMAMHLAWFDACLKDSTRYDAPRAHLFITGVDRWEDFDSYPPRQATERKLYLHSGGRANSLAGDGALSWTVPRTEPADHFTYDPHHPVPSEIAGASYGIDYRPIERRDDVLVYSTDPLTSPVEIIGRVMVHLFAASDARDTDFTARILDVFPDGRALQLGPETASIRRARYRNGFDREELLTPGQPAAFPIELYDIGHVFEPGHRIRIEVSSSAFPMFDPNQNTGNPVATDTEWRAAHQTVLHDAAHASYVSLPVMP